MSCFDTRSCNQVIATTRANATTTTSDNTIVGLLKKIDQMQKTAIANNALSRCDNCIINQMYNTKPIAIYCGCSRFEVTSETETVANLFRVEEVRGNDTVVLRLLENDPASGTITCTNTTLVMRIDCICCIQCYDPMNCTVACFTV